MWNTGLVLMWKSRDCRKGNLIFNRFCFFHSFCTEIEIAENAELKRVTAFSTFPHDLLLVLEKLIGFCINSEKKKAFEIASNKDDL